MGILDNILLAPIKLPVFIAKKIDEMAKEELFNEDKIREDLRNLYLQLEKGEISEEEFEEKEEELVDILEEIAAQKGGG
ncbi:gas vesicle protein GvpG [Candidatus Poribacteria bacterium]|nr:gas vesicle protein GvpG [Candidatus Poribacteria bacterium]